MILDRAGTSVLKVFQLKNFCLLIDSIEKIAKNDAQVLHFISQYVRSYKGPPLDFVQEGFWRDLDAHLAVFHDHLRRGSDNCQP